MSVQRIVMPDGTTKAFPERATKADILDVIAQKLADMLGDENDDCHFVTQFDRDEDYHSPHPSGHGDIMATPEQRALASQQMATLPQHTRGVEWSTSYKNGAFSKWNTLDNPSRSEIDGSGDFNIHFHTPMSDMRARNNNIFPGPGDPAALMKTGKPGFIITPDRNTLLEYGVKDGRYFVQPSGSGRAPAIRATIRTGSRIILLAAASLFTIIYHAHVTMRKGPAWPMTITVCVSLFWRPA
jgi:hypothetical protein